MKTASISGLRSKTPMRKYAWLLLVSVVCGCAIRTPFERTKETYSSLEVTLSDMSKKVIAYYGRQGQMVPPSFDASEFIAILQREYPDKQRVDIIRTTYWVKARAIDGDYSVILCDRQSGNKLLEDFSCTLNRVDLRYWEEGTPAACEFVTDWRTYCK
jgi:hypothetical protein